MFRSDLWYDRWQQVWYLQPEFVQILTWNDYGNAPPMAYPSSAQC
jgi:hypothetical protein